jgi:hypothetical protein
MTTTHTTRRQSQPAVEHDLIGWLLTYRIADTDARPWIGFVGAGIAGLVFAVIKGVWL